MGGESKSESAEQARQQAFTEALRRGDVHTFNALRKEHPQQCLEFADLDLSTTALNLVGFDLSGCKFIRVKFDGLNLTNTRWIGAAFYGCSFRNTNLDGAIFQSARFEGYRGETNTTFNGAKGHGTNFARAVFRCTELASVAFQVCCFSHATFYGVRRSRSPVSLGGSSFMNAEFLLPSDCESFSTEQALSFAHHLSEEQRLELKKNSSTPASLGDQFRAAAARIETEEETASLTPSPSRPDDQTNNTPSIPEGEPPTMAQPQAPSLQDRAIASAKNALGTALSEAEEGLFRATCETAVELGRDGLVKLIDEIAPLSPESREKLVAFFNTEMGKGVTGVVLSGFFSSPLVSMLPGISPRAVTFIQDKVASEIRKGTVFKPAAQTGIRLFLTGPLKGVFDAVTNFTDLVERRISIEEQRGEPKSLDQPRPVIDAFNGPAVPATAAPGGSSNE